MSGQTGYSDQTAPKLIWQFDLGLHCLPVCLHLLNALTYKISLFKLKNNYSNVVIF